MGERMLQQTQNITLNNIFISLHCHTLQQDESGHCQDFWTEPIVLFSDTPKWQPGDYQLNCHRLMFEGHINIKCWLRLKLLQNWFPSFNICWLIRGSESIMETSKLTYTNTLQGTGCLHLLHLWGCFSQCQHYFICILCSILSLKPLLHLHWALFLHTAASLWVFLLNDCKYVQRV